MKTDASSRQGALPFPEAAEAVGRHAVEGNTFDASPLDAGSLAQAGVLSAGELAVGGRRDGMAVPEGAFVVPEGTVQGLGELTTPNTPDPTTSVGECSGEARDFSVMPGDGKQVDGKQVDGKQAFRRISLEGVSAATVAATKQSLREKALGEKALREQVTNRDGQGQPVIRGLHGSKRRTPVRPTQRLYTPAQPVESVQVERLPEKAAPESAVTRERLTIELLLAEPGRAVPVLLATFAFFAASLIF